MYYAESVRSVDKKIFPVVACVRKVRSVEENTIDDDDDDKEEVEAYMGIDADTKLTGNYYLTTNAEPPYNRGAEGFQGDESKSCAA